MERTSKFGQAFILLNRAFGVFCILGGVSMIGTALVCLVRGATVGSSVWISGAIGVVLVAVGALYFKAPLFRRRREESARDLSK
jgi:hypothetical protein